METMIVEGMYRVGYAGKPRTITHERAAENMEGIFGVHLPDACQHGQGQNGVTKSSAPDQQAVHDLSRADAARAIIVLKT